MYGLQKSVCVMNVAKTVGTLEIASNVLKKAKLKQPSLFKPI